MPKQRDPARSAQPLNRNDRHQNERISLPAIGQKPLDLFVVNPIDGKPTLEGNPAILFPNMKSGDAAKPDSNTGVLGAADPTVTSFSMVIDLAPGTYNYLCDIHVGMVGTIVVQ